MKYRRLHLKELNALEKPFIAYLTSMGIPADEWEKIKKSSPDKMISLIDEFSDKVFDDVISKVEYVQRKTSHQLEIVHFEEKQMKIRGLMVQGTQKELDIDLNKVKDLKSFLDENEITLSKFSDTKAYKSDRKMAIFAHLESGYLILTNPDLFELLSPGKSQ